MTSSEQILPTQYLLSPIAQPSTYLTSNNGHNATLTSNTTAALVFWTQNTNPNPAVDEKICTVGGSDSQPANLCLDQWGDNVTQVAINPAGAYSGQLWNRTYEQGLVKGQEQSGWRLQSEFAGSGRWLAIAPDGVDIVMSAGADIGDTLWLFLDPARLGSEARNSSGTSSASATLGPTNSPNAGTPASTATGAAGAKQEEAKSHTLSGGAIAGIVVGIVVALLVALVVLLVVWRRRKKRRAHAELPGTSSTVGRHELAGTKNASHHSEAAELSGQAPAHKSELPGSADKVSNTPDQGRVYELGTEK